MAKRIVPYTKTVTVTGGSGSVEIKDDEFRSISDAGGYLEMILVKAPTTQATFDFKITDSNDFIVYDAYNKQEKINDVTRIPLIGECTVDIQNAQNGDYSVKFMFYRIE